MWEAAAASLRCCGGASVLDSCLVLGLCSSVLLVLESALDCLDLGATTGAQNPLDVLIIGCQDCLQLLLEGVRLHFRIYIYMARDAQGLA